MCGLNFDRYNCVLIGEIHQKVFIYVYLQFKSEFKENCMALTSLYALITEGVVSDVAYCWDIHADQYIYRVIKKQLDSRLKIQETYFST